MHSMYTVSTKGTFRAVIEVNAELMFTGAVMEAAFLAGDQRRRPGGRPI